MNRNLFFVSSLPPPDRGLDSGGTVKVGPCLLKTE